MKTIFEHNETNKDVITLAEFEGILPVCKAWGYKNKTYHYNIYKIDFDIEGNLKCYCNNEVKLKTNNNENN